MIATIMSIIIVLHGDGDERFFQSIANRTVAIMDTGRMIGGLLRGLRGGMSGLMGFVGENVTRIKKSHYKKCSGSF